ncbi:hypothetical protein [Microtetraspora malaysiensis]|uniref:hypothetical protein n=1 Tax=Microtetraspora malaysiensis TaxID=161358 RepID=UPI0012FAD22B|nr:hypothetical protein [Microtetraspora malaysiensis]
MTQIAVVTVTRVVTVTQNQMVGATAARHPNGTPDVSLRVLRQLNRREYIGHTTFYALYVIADAQLVQHVVHEFATRNRGIRRPLPRRRPTLAAANSWSRQR